jgi:hypothetical protein
LPEWLVAEAPSGLGYKSFGKGVQSEHVNDPAEPGLRSAERGGSTLFQKHLRAPLRGTLTLDETGIGTKKKIPLVGNTFSQCVTRTKGIFNEKVQREVDEINRAFGSFDGGQPGDGSG